MYYQNYEDYMRQVLGYPINDPNIYETYDYRNDQMTQDTYSEYYPDIYHLVFPMVCKVCETNTQPITRELVEKMTDEVYMAIEDTSTTVNIRVNASKTEENRTSNSNTSRNNSEEMRTSKSRTERMSKSMNNNTENREVKASNTSVVENRESSPIGETRHSNSTLRDLIKILILNQIFGNRPRPPRPPRPPFPGGPGMPPPRPPFPGGRPPMGPGGRPPMIQPREYPDYLEF
mgnify:CR=1 FL=1